MRSFVGSLAIGLCGLVFAAACGDSGSSSSSGGSGTGGNASGGETTTGGNGSGGETTTTGGNGSGGETTTTGGNGTGGNTGVPDEWTCDPTYYGAGADDGCDCVICGAYDPDCDFPDATVYNCVEGQTCSADGLSCEGVPTAWTCDAGLYGSGGDCDCDCGVPDPDCEDAGATVQNCDAGEVCSAGVCVVDGWLCDPTTYDSGESCDCGCGVVDPDCANAALEVLGCQDGQTCGNTGECAGVPTGWTCDAALFGDGMACNCECGTAFDADCLVEGLPAAGCAAAGETCGPLADTAGEQLDGITCFPIADAPEGWTCNGLFYGADDGCDCGCGIADPDCADGDIGTCEFCGDFGACTDPLGAQCPANINPANTATCTN